MPQIKLDEIQIDYNPRQIFDEQALEELADSIEDKGQVVPVAVTPKDDSDKYHLIFGERRLRALQNLGHETILAEIRDMNPTDVLLAKGIENLSRGDLHFLEEGAYFHKLLYEDDDNGVKTQKQLAKALGISQRDISYKIQVQQYCYFVRNNEFDLRNIAKTDSFGLTHALQLTKLHHEKLIVEKRKENGQTVKLTIEDLLSEVIDDDDYLEEKLNDFIDICKDKQQKELESIIENEIKVNTVKNHIKGHIESIKKQVQDFTDLEREKKCQYRITDDDCALVYYEKEAQVLANDFRPEQEVSFDEVTRFFKEIHLVVTSPPYYAHKEYEDKWSYDEYKEILKDIFGKVYKVLVDGGITCINIGDIPNLDNTGRRCIAEDLNPIMSDIGYQLIDEIIWRKDDPWHNNPHIKYEAQQGKFRILPSFEHIFIYRKGDEWRDVNELKASETIGYGTSKEEWKENVSGVWNIKSVPKNDGHPAEFPNELPRRLIKMYSFVGDLVLDPFCGTGKTMLEAVGLKRHGIGYDPNYKDIIDDVCFEEDSS